MTAVATLTGGRMASASNGGDLMLGTCIFSLGVGLAITGSRGESHAAVHATRYQYRCRYWYVRVGGHAAATSFPTSTYRYLE